ncbi:hypothetical protein PLICRDRAFT_66343, partial [Plicaturopsis crispa FD-325 SS-3]
MGLIRPATPGFIVTLVATILLAIVSFSVPWFKSVFFLKASLAVEGVSGNITFGTLGYCLQLSNGTTCSPASVGYQLDINKLVGDNTKLQIPQVVVKWITYALVLHIVALALAGISAVFGLLAHVREMSMTCCSTCVSGFAALVAMLAFVFDLALFFLAKARLNKVSGGSATMGNAIWLTLAAWVLLFFSGCFYTIGRCCVSRRPRSSARDKEDNTGPPAGNVTRGDQMRLDAVKAEADRKARAKQGEVGLPSFNEYEDRQPLKAHIDGDNVYLDDDHTHAPYHDNGGRQPIQYAGGYAPATPGTRAVDEYYNPSQPQAASSYPPQPRRQGSGQTQTTSQFAPSNYGYDAPAPAVPPVNQYASPAPYGHEQYPSGQDYGHGAGGSTYHSAVEQQYNDPFAGAYAQPQHQQQHSFNPETYNNTAAFIPPTQSRSPPMPQPSTSNYYSPAQSPPERSYTLGGGGYGAN